jgi:hypothetical protein
MATGWGVQSIKAHGSFRGQKLLAQRLLAVWKTAHRFHALYFARFEGEPALAVEQLRERCRAE